MKRTEISTLLKAKRGVTKHKLHKLSGLTRTQIDNIESGATNFTVDSLLLYCEHAGLNILLTKKPDAKPG
jgi:transcriptional regulator with XRE-family HTH domain